MRKIYLFILFFTVVSLQLFSQKTYTKQQVIDISNYIYKLEARDSIFNAKLNSVNDNELKLITDTVRKMTRLVEKYDSLLNKNAELTAKKKESDSLYADLKSKYDALLAKGNNSNSSAFGSNENILSTVLFEINKSIVTAEYQKALDELAENLKSNKEKKIKIEGNADSSGDATHNVQLSAQRAKAVKKYLVSKGVEKSRIYTIGLGADNPISSNNTPEEKAKNRRAEIKALN